MTTPEPSHPEAASFERVLASRRMCRDFEDRPIATDVVDRVLAAALRGPSAGNTWALDLVVLDGPDQTGRYWDVALPAGPTRDGFVWPGLLRAPVLVIPVVDPAAYAERYSAPDKARTGLGAGPDAWPIPYWYVDGGAAVMALLLAAEAVGLGALLFGQFEHEAGLGEAFGIPADRSALGTIALGWPAPGGRAPSHSATRGRPPLGKATHRGRWGA